MIFRLDTDSHHGLSPVKSLSGNQGSLSDLPVLLIVVSLMPHLSCESKKSYWFFSRFSCFLVVKTRWQLPSFLQTELGTRSLILSLPIMPLALQYLHSQLCVGSYFHIYPHDHNKTPNPLCPLPCLAPRRFPADPSCLFMFMCTFIACWLCSLPRAWQGLPSFVGFSSCADLLRPSSGNTISRKLFSIFSLIFPYPILSGKSILCHHKHSAQVSHHMCYMTLKLSICLTPWLSSELFGCLTVCCIRFVGAGPGIHFHLLHAPPNREGDGRLKHKHFTAGILNNSLSVNERPLSNI